MIEILRDLKAGKSLTLSTGKGKGKRIRLTPAPELIEVLAAQVRRDAIEQLAVLQSLGLLPSEVLSATPSEAVAEPHETAAPVPLVEDVPAETAGVRDDTVPDVPVAQPVAQVELSVPAQMIKSYFEQDRDNVPLKCWYVTHELRQEVTRTGWEEVEVDNVGRVKICDLSVYPMHLFVDAGGVLVAEGEGWKLMARY